MISLKFLAVDIDDFDDPDFKPMEKSDKELIDYIKNTFPLIDTQTCNVMMRSGKGLHLYWFLKDEISRYAFEEYEKHLTTYVHGDLACFPCSHHWRMPFSFHCKAEPIKNVLSP